MTHRGAVAASESGAAFVAFVEDRIWTGTYPVRYAGCRFSGRTTVVRLGDGRLIVHSPCPLDAARKRAVEALGPVSFIVAPGTYHYFYVADWQAAFPDAETLICPGLERKLPDLDFDWVLGDRAHPGWGGEIDQVLVRGSRFIWEVAFCHRPTGTLILTDLVENIGDRTPGTDRMLRFWWKGLFRMWNNPKPAPEYQLGWKDRSAARRSLERICELDFERVVISHGDLIENGGARFVRDAWKVPLGFRGEPEC